MIEERSGDLGEFKRHFTFKPAAERFFLVGFLFLFMGLFGLYSVINNAVFGNGEYDYLLAIISSIGLIVSLFYFRHGLSVKSTIIGLFEQGLVVETRQREFQFAWDEIDSVSETVVRKWGSSYWHILMTRNDGEAFGFLEYEVEAPAELRDAIHHCMAERRVPWETKIES